MSTQRKRNRFLNATPAYRHKADKSKAPKPGRTLRKEKNWEREPTIHP